MSIFWVPIVNPAVVDPRRGQPGGTASSPSTPAATLQPQSFGPSSFHAQPQSAQPQSGQPQSGQPQSGQPRAAEPNGVDAAGPPPSGAEGHDSEATVQAASAVPGAGSGSVEELLRQLFGYLEAHAATHPVLEPAVPALGVAVRAYGLHIPALALNQAVAVYHMLEEARAQDPTLPAP